MSNSPNERSLFLKQTSLATFFLFLMGFVCVLLFKFFKTWYLNQFINYKDWSSYNTFSLLLLLFCIITPAILPKLGRMFGLIFYFGLAFCYAHFGAWNIMYVSKILIFEQKMYHIILFTLFANTLATWLSCLM